MLEVVSFLRSGGTLEDLDTNWAISSKRHSEFPNLILLKYNQIESPFSEKIVQECRGIILDEDDDIRAGEAQFIRSYFEYKVNGL